MKILSRFLFPVTIVLFCLSCSDESPISDNGNRDDGLVNMLSVTSEPVRFSSPATKAQYTVSDQDGFVLNWTLGDTIGIYPVGGDQHAFPISSGAGSSYAQFDGGSWALRANYEYAAYYPFSSSNYHVSETAIPVSYEGQTQTANGVTQHLAKYDYQAAAAIAPDKDGNIAVMLKHLGCFVRFQLTMPQADMYTRLILTDSGSGFVTTGTYDLSAQTQAIKSTGTSKTVSMDLKNVSTTSVGQTITLYMMLAPCNMSGHTITLSLSGKTGITYNAELAGKDFQSGKAYSYSLAITSGININGEGVSWGDDEPSQSTHEYVDLGLSVKWATCNIGASTPEKIGNRFAWGEIEPDKAYYDWDNYKWYDNSVNKYTSSDGMYKLESDDDAAIRLWGEGWRMPTENELDELYSKCDWKSEDLNGVSGYRVTGPNGNSIFIPCNGQFDESGIQWNSTVMIWSSERSSSSSYAIVLHSRSGVSAYNHRHDGLCIRPVFEPSQSTHEYVDLGLSVKWATMNVGATSLEEYGDYFAWGETEPYYEPGYAQSSSPVWKSGKSAGYEWSTYKYCNGNYDQQTKYCSQSSYGYNGYTDTKTVLDLEDDAASVNWGGSWRMPTLAEQDELRNTSNCTWEWTTLNGINGYKVTSKKSGYAGNWIFLPAAGCRNGTGLNFVGSYGNYWSSSLNTSDPYFAYFLLFDSSARYTGCYYRCYGLSVRPVCP